MEQKTERASDGAGGTDAMGLYLSRARRHRLLNRREEAALAARIKAGDEEAYEKLVACNLKLVISIARGYTGRGLELADLVQEGNLGLMRAARGFDASFGTKFSTYATWWIKQSIGRAIHNKASQIRVPIHAAEEERAANNARNYLHAVTGREPSLGELSEFVGKSEHEVHNALTLRKAVVSYDVPVGLDDDGSLRELLPDEAGDGAEEPSMENALKTNIYDLLDKLPKRERYVIERRYGFIDDGERATLDNIGAELGVTRERVRQIQSTALRRLHSHAIEAELNSFLELPLAPA